MIGPSRKTEATRKDDNTQPSCSDIVAALRKDAPKITKFAIRGCVIAVGAAGIATVMKGLGQDEAAASSVISSILGLVVGTAAGGVGSGGAEIAAALGRGDHAVLGEIIKAGTVHAFALGSIASLICFAGSKFALPLLLSPGPAKALNDYMDHYVWSTPAEMLLLYLGQVASKVEGDFWYGLLSTIVYRGSAIGLASYFANDLGLGASGVGLGATAASWGTLALSSLWFMRERYRNTPNLFNTQCQHLLRHLRTMLAKGSPLALQRLVEWINLFIITTISGAWSKENLIVIAPSLAMLTLTSRLTQGAALASMLLQKQIKKAFEVKLRDRAPIGDLEGSLRDLGATSWAGNITPLALNTVLSLSLLLFCDDFMSLFLPEGISSDIVDMAHLLFIWNLFSVLGDTLRGSNSGILQGWDDLLIPVLINLGLVTVLGSVIGGFAGHADGESILPLFQARLAAISLAGIVNLCLVMRHGVQQRRTVVELDDLEMGRAPGEPIRIRSAHCWLSCPGNVAPSKTELDDASTALLIHD